jgi:hypothetical protein
VIEAALRNVLEPAAALVATRLAAAVHSAVAIAIAVAHWVAATAAADQRRVAAKSIAGAVAMSTEPAALDRSAARLESAEVLVVATSTAVAAMSTEPALALVQPARQTAVAAAGRFLRARLAENFARRDCFES